MNREEFLNQLSYLLSDIEEEEREEALQYYRDCLEEAGSEEEKELLKRFGSAEKVAAEIRMALSGGEDSGEFTERGYRDERFAEDIQMPDKYAGIDHSHAGWREYKTDSHSGSESSQQRFNQQQAGSFHSDKQGFEQQAQQRMKEGFDGIRKEYQKRDRSQRLLIVILILVFGIPIMSTIVSAGFSVVSGVIGGLIGVFFGLIGLVIAAISAVVAMITGGVGLIGKGILDLTILSVGFMEISAGFLLLALAFLLIPVIGWMCKKVIPNFFRGCIHFCKKAVKWIIETGRNLLNRFTEGGR